MKKLFYLLFLFSISVFSQKRSTTIEEYNYITKGYKIQLESGLDMKSGYTLKNVKQNFSSTFKIAGLPVLRKTSFKVLYKDDEKMPCAVMMICERKDNGYKEYFCLPSANSNLWETFYEDYTKNLVTEEANLSSNERTKLHSLYSYYLHSLKMISFLLTSENPIE